MEWPLWEDNIGGRSVTCKAGESHEYCEALGAGESTKSTYCHVNISRFLAWCVMKTGGVAGWRQGNGFWSWRFGALAFGRYKAGEKTKVVFRKIKVPTVALHTQESPRTNIQFVHGLEMLLIDVGRSLVTQ